MPAARRILAYRGAEERPGRVRRTSIAATRDANEGQTVLPVSRDELAQMAAISRPHVTVSPEKKFLFVSLNYLKEAVESDDKVKLIR